MSHGSFAYHEEMDAEFNSSFDYRSEAFGETARDCNQMAADEAAEELREWCDMMEPEYGPYTPQPRFRFPVETAPEFMAPMDRSETEYGPYDQSDAYNFSAHWNIPW